MDSRNPWWGKNPKTINKENWNKKWFESDTGRY